MTQRGATLRSGELWSGHRNPSGFLFGALVAGAVVALASSATDDALSVGLTVVQVLVVFWAAHVYTRVLTDRLRDGDAGLLERTRESLKHEAAILEGGLPAVGVFTLATLVGASTSGAADAALVATVVLLGSAGYAVGRQAGAHGMWLVGEVAIASLLGFLVVGLKVALH